MIKIGALVIPEIAGFDVNIAYSAITSRSILRAKNGNAIIQSRWRKLGISITGAGWLPDGLDGLNIDVVADIHSTAWLSVSSASNIITIPRAFRTDDYTPQGIAIVGDQTVQSSVALSGSQATVSPVAGASLYQILYCPVITAVIVEITRDFDQQNNIWRWSISAEEQ